jgi:hypothetical protein
MLALLAGVEFSGSWQAPIRLTRNRLVLMTITVEGKDLKALVDTGGANGIELSQAVAKDLKLKLEYGPNSLRRYASPARHVLVGNVKSLKIGDFRESDAQIEVVPGDLEKVSSQYGMTVDAIVGWRFLARFSVRFDYVGGLLAFTSDSPTPSEPSAELPYESFGGNGPVVTGKLDGAPIHFLIDTGAPRSTLNGPRDTGFRPVQKVLTIGAMETKIAMRTRDLSILASAHADAVLGNEFLSGWIFEIDPERKSVRFIRR